LFVCSDPKNGTFSVVISLLFFFNKMVCNDVSVKLNFHFDIESFVSQWFDEILNIAITETVKKGTENIYYEMIFERHVTCRKF
jgi:hypothetical protein